jgi:hypothetical protein
VKQSGSFCGHSSSSNQTVHACHICVPVPEEVVPLLEESSGLNPTDARKAAFVLIRYMKENRHTEGVRVLMKYLTGPTFEGTLRRNLVDKERRENIVGSRQQNKASVVISGPVTYTKEQQMKMLFQNLFRQQGAWTVFEDQEIVIEDLVKLNEYLVCGKT